jgi:hypothetical protein
MTASVSSGIKNIYKKMQNRASVATKTITRIVSVNYVVNYVADAIRPP